MKQYFAVTARLCEGACLYSGKRIQWEQYYSGFTTDVEPLQNYSQLDMFESDLDEDKTRVGIAVADESPMARLDCVKQV